MAESLGERLGQHRTHCAALPEALTWSMRTYFEDGRMRKLPDGLWTLVYPP